MIFHAGTLRSGVDQVLKSPWRMGMAAKSVEGEGDPQRERKHICNSKKKPQELVGDGRFSKYWCCGFLWLWISRKIHTVIYFVSLSLPVPNTSSGPEHQHIHSVILLWRPREKPKHPMPQQEQRCFHQLPFMERTQPWGAWRHAGSEQGRYNLHTAMQAPANQSHAKKSAASQSSRTPSRVANTYILN